MRGSETIAWAGGEHNFRLGIGELRSIEQLSDAGVAVVFMRLIGQQWKIDDVLGPIRLGLMGAGMIESEAKAVLNRASTTHSPYALAITSAEILRRFIMWEGEDAPGEPEAGEANQRLTRSETEEPDGPATTAPELS
ncbi:gene transfer agent family protein [Rhizobium sp. ARZ01]|uniref:gene transfer agent family protein n=1 Tax=Rhizobium sp. ARZ01 TaxID=2769313 RepID=UPI001781F960|nr:gene transfer agent family protein [Rhizobium sp. ARZ01]MBD9372114.1 gene transfer agent family protein [Rhizobium sp. ARZ01]